MSSHEPAAPAAAPAVAQEEPPQPQEPVPEAEAEVAKKAEGEEDEAVKAEGEEEEEEEGECGFCLYMKAGGCRDTFVAWEECVEAAQKDGNDMVERCYEATANLKKCMDAHADYYAPVLRAEEAVNERAEAEVAAAAKDKGVEPATDSENKEEAVPQPAAYSPPAAGVGNVAESKEEAVPQPADSSPPAAGAGNDAESKEEAVPEPAASSPPAAGETKKEEEVAEKV